MNPSETISQIQKIITKLIEYGMSSQQNYPVFKSKGGKTVEIGIEGSPSLSISMKDVPYSEIYEALDKQGAFHIRMIDGALVQMCYSFSRNKVTSHRLCVFPAPYLESFDADPDSYANDEIYADIVGRSIVHVPIRFDFDDDPKQHVDIKHPKSHLTFGQYKNCRIPVNSPVSPIRFMKFVLRNFYHSAYYAGDIDNIDSSFCFDDTITTSESKISHLRC